MLTASGTLVTLVSLLLFGGPVIRDFALVLILGIFIGTFSSIFVASPVLYFIEQQVAAQGRAAAGGAVRQRPSARPADDRLNCSAKVRRCESAKVTARSAR